MLETLRPSISKKKFIICGIAVLGAISAALSAALSPAVAEPATTSWTAYVYQGPGTHYAVVDELAQATPVDVDMCKGEWCRITSEGRIGYLRAEVVARGDAAHPAAGVLAQPAAALSATPPAGPCFRANQTGGNGGNAMTVYCGK